MGSKHYIIDFRLCGYVELLDSNDALWTAWKRPFLARIKLFVFSDVITLFVSPISHFIYMNMGTNYFLKKKKESLFH